MKILAFIAAGLTGINLYTFWVWPFIFVFAVMRLLLMSKTERKPYFYLFLAGIALLFMLTTPETVSLLLADY